MATPSPSPAPLYQALVAGFILVVGAGAALAIRFSGEKSTTTLEDVERAGTPVVVATAREVALRTPVDVAGRLKARHAVDLAPEVEGRLVEIRAEVGDVLKAGTVAFRLDDRDAHLDLENRRARLAAAEARGRQAERRAERRRRLGEEGVTSKELVEEAGLDDDVARAELMVARKELRLAERALEKTAVAAPWTGTVVARHADPGAWVLRGQRVLRLVDLSRFDVWVDVPAPDAVHLRPGDAAAVRFPALPGESFAGRLRFIADEASDGDLQFPVTVELAGDERLADGMIAEVELTLRRAGRGVAVPLDAIAQEDAEDAADEAGDRSFVWLLEDGRVHRRAVVVAGARRGRAILHSGLAHGDRVIVAVSSRLEDGQAVGPVSETTAPGPSAP